MTAIQTEHLHYQSGAFQLRDITVSFPREQMTAIVGPNGSGKSTLLKVITRLLHADQGELYVDNRKAAEFTTIQYARTLSMLTQSRHSLPDLTVRELVSYGRSPYKRIFDRMTSNDEHIVDWAMEITGTRRYEQRMFHTLSGGEQQKARIAMALAQKTNIVLLDEPTTFLDIAHQLDVMEMLRKIHQEHKLTIVMVLHDLQQAVHYCHYLIAMKNGRIQTTGKPKDVLSPEFLKDVYQIEAKVKFEDEYPIIIPIRKQ
ncbi:ABC transporter ATP-binding protein [Paenibacillus sp.]|uniref:ABC transporter ATP-binding protein n=1 Tax=Paenibacillus TaxID=44249 RepID=UPI003561B90E